MKRNASNRHKPFRRRTAAGEVRPDPDKLSPKLAKLKMGELINALPRYQAALNTALTGLSEAPNTAALLASRVACQEIQIIIGRLIKLNRISVKQLLPKPKPGKKPIARPYKPNEDGSVWAVGSGQCRKPGSYRS